MQAKAAYTSFIAEVSNAERHPAKANYARLEQLSTAPAIGQIKESIGSLAYNDLAYAGIAPRSRLTLVADRSKVSSNPTVLLRDCPTIAKGWVLISTKTGKPETIVQDKAPDPHPISVIVVPLRGRWVVSTADTNRGATCTS